MKKCAGCRQIKKLDQFNINQASPDGYSWQCKSCLKLCRAAAYKRRPEHFKAISKVWKEQNPEKREATNKVWCEKNRTRIAEVKKTYFDANKEIVRAQRAEQKKRARERRRIWKRDSLDPAAILGRAIHYKWYRARQEKKARRIARENFVPINYKQAMLDAYGGQCCYCGVDDPDVLTIDHIDNAGAEHRRLLGTKGPNMPKYLRRLGYPKDNYQLLCRNCNWKKHIEHQRNMNL